MKKMKCQRCKLGEPDSSGRRRPVAIEGSDFTVDCDQAVIAVGLSANQVGVSKRVAVINPTGRKEDELILINPKIVHVSGSAKMEEGCLSVPGVSAEVKRAAKVGLNFMDLFHLFQIKNYWMMNISKLVYIAPWMLSFILQIMHFMSQITQSHAQMQVIKKLI